MTEVEVPELDWEERYRRMIEIAYTLFLTSELEVHSKCESDKSEEIRDKLHEAVGSVTGKRIVENFDLEPTVEDALKLFKLYSAEVWGYGADEYVSTDLESDEKGTYANLACRGWEIAKRRDLKDTMEEMDCGQGCITEYASVLKELSPDLDVEMTKALPWGDDHCEWVVEK